MTTNDAVKECVLDLCNEFEPTHIASAVDEVMFEYAYSAIKYGDDTKGTTKNNLYLLRVLRDAFLKAGGYKLKPLV